MYYFQSNKSSENNTYCQCLVEDIYSSLGFFVIKDFATSTKFEVARRRFHYDTGKSKEYDIKTIGLQCLYTIPRRVKFLHDD